MLCFCALMSVSCIMIGQTRAFEISGQMQVILCQQLLGLISSSALRVYTCLNAPKARISGEKFS